MHLNLRVNVNPEPEYSRPELPLTPDSAAQAQQAKELSGLLLSTKIALQSCTTGSYTAVDGDFVRTYSYDRKAVSEALVKINNFTKIWSVF